MNLLRTIRLDPSDTFVFARAAEPGEWAVSGAFVFWSGDIEMLEGKARAAFRSGLLGVDSWGWSTLAQVVEVSEDDRVKLVDALALQLVARLGAPSLNAARRAAQEEVSFASSLCNHPPGTLIAVHRTAKDGELREAFRTLRRSEGEKPARAFAFLEVQGEDETLNDTINLVDLADLAERNVAERKCR